MPLRTEPRPRGHLLVAGVLVALVAAAFAPVGGNGFVSLDDGIYLTENPAVLAGLTTRGLAWAFTTFHAGNWHPLTWVSHMLDVELLGLQPGPHHAVNVLLHAAAAVGLFVALRRLTGSLWCSALAVSLFALHPLRVESVAWAAQRKDVLSGFFFSLALLGYAGYVRRPSGARYLAALVAFAAGLMAKPVLVTVPVLLLLADAWPLGRIGPQAGPGRPAATRVIGEKVPFLLLAAVSSALTVLAQQNVGAMMGLAGYPLPARAANAVVSVARYLHLTLWPDRLAPFYPLPDAPWPPWQAAAALALVLLVSAACAARWRRQPWLALGWCWFLAALAPVIGLIQVGSQALADRYTWLPHVGLAMAVAWTAGAVPPARAGLRRCIAGAAMLLVLALLVRTRVQSGYWQDNLTLFTRTLAATGENALAFTKLGEHYETAGDAERSLQFYARAARAGPRFALTHHNYGVSLMRAQRFADAVVPLEEAVRLDPGHAEAFYYLGLAFLRTGRAAEANRAFAAALHLRPGRAAARQGYVESLVALGRCDEAIAASRTALEQEPESPIWHFFLAQCLASRGELAAAVEHYRAVLRRYPGDPDVRSGLTEAQRRLEAAGTALQRPPGASQP